MSTIRPKSCRATKLFAAVCAALLAGCGADVPNEAVPHRDGDELVLAVSPVSPPYTYKGKDGEILGIDIEIARDAARKMGRPLKIVTTDFDALLPTVKSGAADMAASGITITDGRRRSVDFSDSYVTDGGAFLYRTGEKTPTLVTAEAIRLATVDASTHDFYLTNHGLDPIRYRTSEHAINALSQRKVDAVYSDMSTLSEWAAKSEGRFSVSPLVTRENIGVAVRKDFPELKAAVNAAIKERKAK